MNLAHLIDSHDADRVALISRGRSTTYGALREQVACLRGGLAGLGVGQGDRVALLCGNGRHFVLGYLATLGIGAVAVPLNPTSPAPEIERAQSRAAAGGRGEEQLVVFPAVERERARVRLGEPGETRGERQAFDVDRETMAARPREASGVDEESVAHVHHRSRDARGGEHRPGPETGDGTTPTPSCALTVRNTTSGHEQAQPERRAAEAARDPEIVPGASAAAEDRALRRVAEDGEGEGQVARRREIAARKRRPNSASPLSSGPNSCNSASTAASGSTCHSSSASPRGSGHPSATRSTRGIAPPSPSSAS